MTFLHWVGNALRAQLERIPLQIVHWMFIALFLLLMFWIVQLRPAAALPGDRQSKWYEDLRIWSWVALIFQILIYSVF